MRGNKKGKGKKRKERKEEKKEILLQQIGKKQTVKRKESIDERKRE